MHILVLGHGKKSDGTLDKGARGVDKWEREYLEDLAVELKKLIDLHKLPVQLITEYNTFNYNDFRNNPEKYRSAKSVTDLHLNAFNGKAKGSEIIISEHKKADEIDVRLQERLAKRFGWRRWIISDWYQQTREATKNRIPSFRLIEYVFCDNKENIDTYVREIKETAQDTLEAILNIELKEQKPITKDILFRVQTGAYKVEQNAKDLASKLNQHGYSTYMVYEKDRNLWKVQVGAFSNKDNAVKLSKELTQKGYETYIITTGETDSVYIPQENRYSNEEMAYRVIAGHYGTGQERIKNLQDRGYDYGVIQELVNDILIKNQPVKMKAFLKLHSNVTSWRVYPLGVARTPNNVSGILNPSIYGGLEYEILEFRENKQVAVIQTSMFGKVQIWIGSDTKSLYSIYYK